jgi:hypothetical protein
VALRTRRSPRRDLFDLRCIAEVISRFDIVAIEEAREDLSALRLVLATLGDSSGLIATDVTRGRAGNNERLVFVFDTRRVKPSGLAGELVVALETRSRMRRSASAGWILPKPTHNLYLTTSMGLAVNRPRFRPLMNRRPTVDVAPASPSPTRPADKRLGDPLARAPRRLSRRATGKHQE